MANNMTVDEFVQAKVLPEFHSIVAMLRELMKECAPDVEELVSYGLPAYRRGKRILAVISPTRKDITFSFSRGVQFEDKYGLLKGVGKSSKHVKIDRRGRRFACNSRCRRRSTPKPR